MTTMPRSDEHRSGSRLSAAAARIFGLDQRALAAFRIGIAATVLIDLALRAMDLQAHYTDAGVLPRQAWLALANRPWEFSIHLMTGSWVGQAILFALAAACAACLLLGYRTRSATIATWALLLSLHNRNPFVLLGADTMLRCLLFWAMFVPLGGRWSLDSRRRPAAPRRAIASPATAALMLQVCLVYWCTGVFKSHPVWTQDGTALVYLFQSEYATPLGASGLAWPGLLRLLSFAALHLELFGPLLLFVPWRRDWFRAAAVVAFVAMHLAMAATLHLGIFPLVSVVAWIPFLPAGCLDRMARWFAASRHADALGQEAFAPADGRPLAASRGRGWIAWGGDATVVILLVLVGLWNIRTLAPRQVPWLVPEPAGALLRLVKLDQRWRMFAAKPPTSNRWISIPARLQDGREVDLARADGEPAFRAPARSFTEREGMRWIKYREYIRRSARGREWYARYLCEEWRRATADDPTQAIARLDLMLYQQKSRPDLSERPAKRTRLFTYRPHAVATSAEDRSRSQPAVKAARSASTDRASPGRDRRPTVAVTIPGIDARRILGGR
ncbi:MAG TPA: HTTM domain-containing protein [Planctomycetota bacterium]|nr:HTTM domain-containing protein [Planctomycetota bacterium]